MQPEEIESRKEAIERLYGPWTASEINLGHGLATLPELTPVGPANPLFRHQRTDWPGYSPGSSRVRRVVQIIADLAGKPLKELRILDLACLEGGFALELGAWGASVLGVDGREGHIAKANFVRDVLGQTNVTFVVDDVRNVNRSTYGVFDVVLCLGILYHLPAPEVFVFAEAITDACSRLLIVDTEVAMTDLEMKSHRGCRYYGMTTPEHEPSASSEEQLRNAWMSIGNTTSFMLTRFSLYNLFADLGFSSGYECFEPAVLGHGARTTFVAVKGTSMELRTASKIKEGREAYSEAGSGRRDSELHLLGSELARMRRNPLVPALSWVRRYAGRLLRRLKLR
jgi:hypothetical protein